MKLKIRNNDNNGFVALISVIITSAILLIIATSLGFRGFYSRYNALDSEMKKVSVGLAEACADQGILMLATEKYNLTTSTIKVFEKGYCDLGLLPQSGNPRIFLTQASTSKYFTTLVISINPDSNFSVISWQEVP